MASSLRGNQLHPAGNKSAVFIYCPLGKLSADRRARTSIPTCALGSIGRLVSESADSSLIHHRAVDKVIRFLHPSLEL